MPTDFELGHPGEEGVRIVVDGREATVLAIESRVIARVQLMPRNRQNTSEQTAGANGERST